MKIWVTKYYQSKGILEVDHAVQGEPPYDTSAYAYLSNIQPLVHFKPGEWFNTKEAAELAIKIAYEKNLKLELLNSKAPFIIQDLGD